MDYVGIPFRDGGRDADGADCYGLVRLFFRTEFGVALPAYGETPASDLSAAEAAVRSELAGGAWRSVDRLGLRRGDVVLMAGFERVKGRPVRTRRHLGVMVDPRRMLHLEEATDAVIVPLSHPSVRGRLESFWRHESLLAAGRT